MPALLVVDHHQAARIARLLMLRSRPGESPRAHGPANLQTAFTRLRERLENKNVTIKHVKEVALESLARAKAQIEDDSSL